jgi:hypothetical protein
MVSKQINRTGVDVKHAKLVPNAEFESPHDVVADEDLSHENKAKILKQWEQDARALVRAADEGMAGEAPATPLPDIQKARKQLREESVSPDKHDQRK